MKKLTSVVICFLLLLAITLSCGCMSFVADKQLIGGEGNQNGGTQSDYSVVLDSSAEMATSVRIASIEERPTSPLSEQAARIKVARTSVAIKTSGYGSGVIINIDDGVDYGDLEDNIFYVVTCHHMISSGGDITVYVPDEDYSYDNESYIFSGTIGGSVAEGQAVSLIGGDIVSDIALLKLFISDDAIARTIEKAEIMDTSRYSVGLYENVFAIGNPTGTLPGSSTSLGVANPVRENILCESAGYMTLLQIAVGTNPGNSGGGLYNLYGELVGITNAGNTNYESINFAIPLKTTDDPEKEDRGVVNIVGQLLATYRASGGKNYGYVSGRWSLGVRIDVNSSDTMIYFKQVDEGSMAETAGAISYSYESGKQKYQEIVSIAFFNKAENSDENYQISSLIQSGFTASSAFSLVMGMMKSTLVAGDSFTITVGEHEGRKITYKELAFEIDNAFCIFADTGVYDGIEVEQA